MRSNCLQGGASSKSNPNPGSQRVKGVVISALIEHPEEGLILFETGSGPNWPDVWGAPMNDLFAQVDFIDEQDLDKAIAKTGHNIKDVTAVIMGHLPVDHAGGLEYFKGTE
jgi:glyoxylase-like metal-dependent hydrolase (beta-lactamase superfamily II)